MIIWCPAGDTRRWVRDRNPLGGKTGGERDPHLPMRPHPEQSPGPEEPAFARKGETHE